MSGDDVLTSIHEAGHAVIASQFGLDVRHVQMHRDGGGCCEIRSWLEEVNNDPIVALVYMFAAGAAEQRLTGRPSVRDAVDRAQALELARVMHDHAAAADPRVVAALRAAEALATAAVQNATTWAHIERTARALRRRKQLSGRDVQELRREAGR
jgi:hypothetical protein